MDTYGIYGQFTTQGSGIANKTIRQRKQWTTYHLTTNQKVGSSTLSGRTIFPFRHSRYPSGFHRVAHQWVGSENTSPSKTRENLYGEDSQFERRFSLGCRNSCAGRRLDCFSIAHRASG